MIICGRCPKTLKFHALSWHNAISIKMMHRAIVSLETILSDYDLSMCIHGL